MTTKSDSSGDERKRELEALPNDALITLRDGLKKNLEKHRTREERAELMASLARHRALKLTGDVLVGPGLESRIEKLFDAFREKRKPWPVEDAVRVFDGLVGRLVSRRLWLGLIGLVTIVPAIASLILLASQNGDQIEKNRVEQLDLFRKTHAELTDAIHAVTLQNVTENGESSVVKLPLFHGRLRTEAFSSLIAIEKQRWSRAEREAMPPVRFVNLRNGDYSGLVLGERIGVDESNDRTDFTRLYLEGSNLTGAFILNCWLDGCVFRNCTADGITIVSPSAASADFSGMQALGSRFEHNAKTGDFFSLEETNFDRANLRDATFLMVFAVKASFDETDLTGVAFEESGFAECDFTTATLGESADWSNSRFHKCLVTDEQAAIIVLADYCYLEDGDKEGTRRIMTDPDKYAAWYEQYAAEMKKAAIEELRELGVKPEDYPEHLK